MRQRMRRTLTEVGGAGMRFKHGPHQDLFIECEREGKPEWRGPVDPLIWVALGLPDLKPGEECEFRITSWKADDND